MISHQSLPLAVYPKNTYRGVSARKCVGNGVTSPLHWAIDTWFALYCIFLWQVSKWCLPYTSGACFTNNYSCTIQLWWKSYFTLIQILMKWLLQNFAEHNICAVMACTQFVVIWSQAIEIQVNDISLEIELWRKNLPVKCYQGLLCNIRYLSKTHLKSRSHEISSAHNFFINNPIILKFCAEHCSHITVLCVNSQSN